MRVFRIVLISLLSILDVYCIYATIGYLILGIQTPKIIGNITTFFMGMYIMSITFFVIAIICSILIFVIARKLKKSKSLKQ